MFLLGSGVIRTTSSVRTSYFPLSFRKIISFRTKDEEQLANLYAILFIVQISVNLNLVLLFEKFQLKSYIFKIVSICPSKRSLSTKSSEKSNKLRIETRHTSTQSDILLPGKKKKKKPSQNDQIVFICWDYLK